MSSKNILPLFSKIVQKEWTQLHPLKIQSTSDFYYIQLSNKILNILLKDKNVIEFPISLLRQFALISTAYFEDVISKIGILIEKEKNFVAFTHPNIGLVMYPDFNEGDKR